MAKSRKKRSARRLPPWVGWAARSILFGIAVLWPVPVRWHVTGTGLDPSWAFALNYAHAKGLVFGRDLVFAYGPWSWLTVPQAAG